MKKYISKLTLSLFVIFLVIQFIIPPLTVKSANAVRGSAYNAGFIIFIATRPLRIPAFGLLSKQMHAYVDPLGQLPENKALRTTVTVLSLFIYSLIISKIIQSARRSPNPKRSHYLLLALTAVGALACAYKQVDIALGASLGGGSRDFEMVFMSLAYLFAFIFISLIISRLSLRLPANTLPR